MTNDYYTMKRLGVTKPRGAMMRNITSATLFHENANTKTPESI